MKKYIILFVLCLFFCVQIAYASEDFGLNDYERDINTPADANALHMYNAWSENMAYRIEHGASDGIIIDSDRETGEYISDGIGNVIIKDGANVGPIINQTDLSNIIIIIKSKK